MQPSGSLSQLSLKRAIRQKQRTFKNQLPSVKSKPSSSLGLPPNAIPLKRAMFGKSAIQSIWTSPAMWTAINPTWVQCSAFDSLSFLLVCFVFVFFFFFFFFFFVCCFLYLLFVVLLFLFFPGESGRTCQPIRAHQGSLAPAQPPPWVGSEALAQGANCVVGIIHGLHVVLTVLLAKREAHGPHWQAWTCMPHAYTCMHTQVFMCIAYQKQISCSGQEAHTGGKQLNQVLSMVQDSAL